MKTYDTDRELPSGRFLLPGELSLYDTVIVRYNGDTYVCEVERFTYGGTVVRIQG